MVPGDTLQGGDGGWHLSEINNSDSDEQNVVGFQERGETDKQTDGDD